MNKKEYLVELQEALKKNGIREEVVKEVIDDYEEHFVIGKSNGKTEEEICQELGTVDEMVREILAMDSEFKKEELSQMKVVQSEVIQSDNVTNNSYEGTKEEAGPFSKLKVDGISGKIYITRGDTLKVNFDTSRGSQEKSGFNFVHYQNGDTFYVGLKPKMGRIFSFLFLHERVDLYIQVPNFVSIIDVSNASGYIKIDGVNADYLEAYNASGEIDINNVHMNTVLLKTSSGNVNACNCSGQKATLRSSSGSISLNSCDFDTAVLKTASGNVRIIDGRIDKLEAHTASGDIQCTAKTKEGFAKCVSGDISYIIYQSSQVRCETVSGDSQIVFAQPNLGYRIDFSTVSGSASIMAGDMQQTKCKGGTYTYGNQECKLSIKSVSGSANIK